MGKDDDKAAKRVRTYWDADPVHMGIEGYWQLARGLLDKVALAAENTESKQQPGPSGSSSGNRQGWADDAVARRSDTNVTFRGGYHSRPLWTRGRAAHRGARGGRRSHDGRDARYRGHGGRRYRPY
jgi:hypothetical protein